MKIGFDEMDMGTHTVETEEDQDPRTDKSHKETENEKPERSRDSSIHTAHQFLVDMIFQVLKCSQIVALISC